MTRNSPLAQGRGSRLLKLGRLAGGIAAGMAAEGVRQLASGSLPKTGDLLLTRQNADRIADSLSELRGAAMKVGQLLSMEAGDLLPPELTEILARLREDAHRMPLGQVASVLNGAWGEDWPQHFRRFNFQPLAAASIGQVHEAITQEGQRLAIKIQYPGVRNSIDSDVDNVARLLSLVRALPEQLDVCGLLAEAKQQLHEEADYRLEAEKLEAYRRHLGEHPLFEVPRLQPQWTTGDVLCMSYLGGASLEQLAQEAPLERNRVAAALLDLAVRELFDWGLVQTDPNFANYRYDRDTRRVGLVDFGAVRRYPEHRVAALRGLLTAAIGGDRDQVREAAIAVGYKDQADPPEYRQAVTDLIMDATEPARHDGDYDFSASDLAQRMSRKVMTLRFESGYWRMPPVDLLFLHRKLGGLYMLFTRLGSRIPVHRILRPHAASLGSR